MSYTHNYKKNAANRSNVFLLCVIAIISVMMILVTTYSTREQLNSTTCEINECPKSITFIKDTITFKLNES